MQDTHTPLLLLSERLLNFLRKQLQTDREEGKKRKKKYDSENSTDKEREREGKYDRES
jgi:hypothetical protein